MTIEYRVVHDPEELKVIVELETIVWSMPASEAVPHNMLFALIHSGWSGTICADNDGKAVRIRAGNRGAARYRTNPVVTYGGGDFRTSKRRNWLCVETGTAGLGARTWLQSYRLAIFDPLQRKNAKLCMLKAFTSSYHVNFYGEMADGINKGMPSDRLEVTWNFEDEMVITAANRATSSVLSDNYARQAFLLHSLDDGLPQVHIPSSLSEKSYYVEIPYHLAALKRDNIQLAKDWQIGLNAKQWAAPLPRVSRRWIL